MKRLALAAGAALAILCVEAGGQTAMEYGAGMSARTAGAGPNSLAGAVGSTLGKASEALERANRSGASGARPASRGSASGKVLRVRRKPPVQYRATPEAFAKLEMGLPAAELEKLLGPPSFRVLMPAGGQLIELLEYSSSGKLIGTVRVVDGKVAEARPAGQ